VSIDNPPKGRLGTILVVDDAPMNLKLLSDLLKEEGFKIKSAPSADLALSSLEASLPDLILLDVNLPGTNGVDLCRTVKKNELWASIPVLFISALGTIEDKLKGFAAGGVDYITKPFQKEEVLARIRAHLTIRNLQKDLEDKVWELKVLYEQVKDLSIRDSLTGLYNRRYLDEVMLGQISRSTRYRHPLSVIVADLDYFKRVNDSFGHTIGDEVLAKTAQVLLTCVRDSDVVGRIGGEEFMILCPETNKTQAIMVGERIRKKMENLEWEEIQPGLVMTISIGVGSTEQEEEKEDVSTIDRRRLFDLADKSLYLAKESGRNKVVAGDL
jgi:diguanylate cyclase (GGDEF)-like protein